MESFHLEGCFLTQQSPRRHKGCCWKTQAFSCGYASAGIVVSYEGDWRGTGSPESKTRETIPQCSSVAFLTCSVVMHLYNLHHFVYQPNCLLIILPKFCYQNLQEFIKVVEKNRAKISKENPEKLTIKNENLDKGGTT